MKQNILINLKQLDKETEVRELKVEEWQARYRLKEDLMEIYRKDEIWW